MKIGIALTLLIACPSMAAAQYGFQLRPSPYRILSGWEQSANSNGQTVGSVARAAAPVSDRGQAGQIDLRRDRRAGDATGGAYRTQSTH